LNVIAVLFTEHVGRAAILHKLCEPTVKVDNEGRFPYKVLFDCPFHVWNGIPTTDDAVKLTLLSRRAPPTRPMG
jgi:hypothetical protein